MNEGCQKHIPIQRVRLQFNDGDALKSLSAVERIGDHLFLGSDESLNLERLSPDKKGGFAAHRSFPVSNSIDLPPSKADDIEIDIEGLSFDDGFLWLVGSHSLKREKAKSKKKDPVEMSEEMIEKLATVTREPTRYVLARIPVIKDAGTDEVTLRDRPADPADQGDEPQAAWLRYTERGNALIDALASDSHLAGFLPPEESDDKEDAKAALARSIPSKDNGLDIEGLAARGNRLFVGLRGPVLRGWAMVLELEVEASASELKLREIGPGGQRYRKHFLRLDGLGVRDLIWRGGDLLVLAGPTMELDGPVRVYRWSGVAALNNETITPREKLELLLDLPYGEGEDHAEGMTVFDGQGSKPLLLVVYDSPGKIRQDGPAAVYADLFALSE